MAWAHRTVRVDADLLAEVEDLAPDQLRSGVGAGLRLSTPVGPVRLDVGYPLDRVENQDQKPRVYLSIGHPF